MLIRTDPEKNYPEAYFRMTLNLSSYSMWFAYNRTDSTDFSLGVTDGRNTLKHDERVQSRSSISTAPAISPS